MPTRFCKHRSKVKNGREVRKQSGFWLWVSGLLTCGVFALLIAGCQPQAPVRAVDLDRLEMARPERVQERSRSLVRDAALFSKLCRPLGRRMGLIEITSRADWEALRRATTLETPCPDFREGSMVGIASTAGMPVDGSWPVFLDSVRVHDGGGMVRAHFRGGCYLPDTTGYIETVFVPGLRRVLVVDVDGVRFFPEACDIAEQAGGEH